VSNMRGPRSGQRLYGSTGDISIRSHLQSALDDDERCLHVVTLMMVACLGSPMPEGVQLITSPQLGVALS